MSELAETGLMDETADVLTKIGRRIRYLRLRQGLSLQALGQRTGLSASMLSLLERGKTGPSIGTLVVVASALDSHVSEFLDDDDTQRDEIVSRRENQRIIQTRQGVKRRILRYDRTRGIELSISEFERGMESNSEPWAHEGFEYGVVLQGELTLTLGSETHVLKPGDLVSYSSTIPHRLANSGAEPAQTLWINVKRA